MEPKLLESESGYNFVSYQDRIYGVPQDLGPLDIRTIDLSGNPNVIIGRNLHSVRRQVIWYVLTTQLPLKIVPMINTPANVKFFGSSHPAYAPLLSSPYNNIKIVNGPSSVECNSVSLRQLDYSIQTFRQRMRKLTIDEDGINSFIDTRDYFTQLIVAKTEGIHFFQGVPLTLGYRPWMIQLENPTTLLLPYLEPSLSLAFQRDASFYKIVRALLRSRECLGIITNLQKTKIALPLLFKTKVLASKIFYLPFCFETPREITKNYGQFLFTTSWHQHDESFFNRGGVDAILIFDELARSHKDLNLIIRAKIPARISPDVRAALNKPNVRVIEQKIEHDEMERLFAESAFYLLPASDLHSMSTLQAMAHGCICILADSWGSDEYLHHGINGLRICGREGKYWKYQRDEGIILENYAGMDKADYPFIKRAVNGISELISDTARRFSISNAARIYARDHHSAAAGRVGFEGIVIAMLKQYRANSFTKVS